MDARNENLTGTEPSDDGIVETRSRHASLNEDSIVNEQGCGPEPIGLRPPAGETE